MNKPDKFDELQDLARTIGLRLTYDDDYPVTIRVYRRDEDDQRNTLFESNTSWCTEETCAFLMGWIACLAR